MRNNSPGVKKKSLPYIFSTNATIRIPPHPSIEYKGIGTHEQTGPKHLGAIYIKTEVQFGVISLLKHAVWQSSSKMTIKF